MAELVAQVGQGGLVRQGGQPGNQVMGLDHRIVVEAQHLLVAIQDQWGAFCLGQLPQCLAHGLGPVLHLELHQVAVSRCGQRHGLFGFRGRRHRDFQPAGHEAQAGALAKQGDQYHHQGDIEQQVGLLHPGQQREHRQHNGHGAAQPGPGNKGLLPPGETERQQADPHGDRARQQHQKGRHRQGPGQVVGESGGRYQQTENQEHARLGQPGHGIHGFEHVVAGAAATVAGHQAEQINGQKA